MGGKGTKYTSCRRQDIKFRRILRELIVKSTCLIRKAPKVCRGEARETTSLGERYEAANNVSAVLRSGGESTDKTGPIKDHTPIGGGTTQHNITEQTDAEQYIAKGSFGARRHTGNHATSDVAGKRRITRDAARQ